MSGVLAVRGRACDSWREQVTAESPGGLEGTLGGGFFKFGAVYCMGVIVTCAKEVVVTVSVPNLPQRLFVCV